MKKIQIEKAKNTVLNYYIAKDLRLEIDNLIKNNGCVNVRKAAEYMVEGGCFAIYYDDQRRELAGILGQTREESLKYNDEKVYKKYIDVISQAINKILK